MHKNRFSRSPENVLREYKTDIHVLSGLLGADFISILLTSLAITPEVKSKLYLAGVTVLLSALARVQHLSLKDNEGELTQLIMDKRIELRRQPKYFLHLAEALSWNEKLKVLFAKASRNQH